MLLFYFFFFEAGSYFFFVMQRDLSPKHAPKQPHCLSTFLFVTEISYFCIFYCGEFDCKLLFFNDLYLEEYLLGLVWIQPERF